MLKGGKKMKNTMNLFNRVWNLRWPLKVTFGDVVGF